MRTQQQERPRGQQRPGDPSQEQLHGQTLTCRRWGGVCAETLRPLRIGSFAAPEGHGPAKGTSTCLPAPHRSQRPPLRAPSGWARQPRGSSARKTRHTCGPLGAAAPLRDPRGEGAPLRAARWGRPQFLSEVRPDVSKLYLVRTCRAEGLSTPLGSVLHLHAEVWRSAAAGRDPRVCRERPRVAAPPMRAATPLQAAAPGVLGDHQPTAGQKLPFPATELSAQREAWRALAL